MVSIINKGPKFGLFLFLSENIINFNNKTQQKLSILLRFSMFFFNQLYSTGNYILLKNSVRIINP